MSRYPYLSGVLLSLIFMSPSCSSLTLNLKNRFPATYQSILALLWLLARFHVAEKRRRVLGWQFEDLALPKIMKDNATWILNHHHPGKKIISLEDWKE